MPDDEWDWDVLPYDAHLVAWLVDMYEAFGRELTPMQILNHEHEFPGLLKAMDTVIWQRQLMDQTMNENDKT